MGLEWIKFPSRLKGAITESSSEDVKRALLLALYCAELENGGMIEGCGNWRRSQWHRLVGCSAIRQGVDAAGLWHWQGDDLFVDYYDKEAEARAQATRVRRQAAALKRWQNDSKLKQKESEKKDAKYSKHNVEQVTLCNAEENRIDKKEINKEKSEEPKGLDSPEMAEIMAQMKQTAESHTLK